MRVWCALTARELDAEHADLIVFPEGVCENEIADVERSHPDAMIVAAIVENGRSRGVLRHRRENRIEYLKVATDGRTVGTGDYRQSPVYESEDMCVGVLICMDTENRQFSRSVIEKIRDSSSALKLLCVPADMGDYWFSGDRLPFPQVFEGIHLILCNHTKTHQDRCKSFITDTRGTKIVVQQQEECISAELP
ncbi:MAG: hypothetical protein D4S02_17795 [Rhodocyclaceae bacterium]|nr:MAG: hypothetical protein D4S02_17795 [Rhodocyclaceae bacterium]